MEKRKKRVLCLFGICITLLIVSSTPFQEIASLPKEVRVMMGSHKEIHLSLPAIASASGQSEIIAVDGGTIIPKKTGEAKIDVKIGKVPIKSVNVNVLPDLRLYPGGQSIGVKLQSAGIIVVGHKQVVDQNNIHISPAEEADIQIGDLIVKINDKAVNEASELGDIVNEAGKKGDSLSIELIRGNEKKWIKVKPVKDKEDQMYKLGLYVRDSAAGVGTMTFYDPVTKRYGALGHVISDLDTQKPIVVGKGNIVSSTVTSVDRGKEGKPGSIRAIFPDEKKSLGNIDKNTPFGIFGTLDKSIRHPVFKEPLPIGLVEEVKEGPAEILTVVEGNRIERYSIEIVNVIRQRYPSTKGMIIKVTDPRLIQKTGGIVQGMSGSPIIQEGKLIGAVTHVFVNDPTQGYGLFIEWMIEEAGIDMEKKSDQGDRDFAA